MKKTFVNPELDVVKCNDVIVTSGGPAGYVEDEFNDD